VRDGLLGLGGADIDLATRFTPDEVMKRVRAAGLKAVPTGIAHGTVTVVGHDLVAEVTTLRRDVQSFGRHAQVAFTDDWREDAARRDFTVNALYAHLPDGVIDDYWGGLDDLLARRVRFIGDPLQRIAEDHLRMRWTVVCAAKLRLNFRLKFRLTR
jgi:poly(A) polymerase